MASVHTTVSIQAFSGLEHRMVGTRLLCAHTQEEEWLVEKHERLFEAKTYSPVEDTYARRGHDAR